MNSTAQRQEYIELTETPRMVGAPAASPLRARLRALSAAAARSPAAHRALAAFLLIGLPGVGAYAYFVEPTWLRIRRLVVPLPTLPLGLDGIRIVHLSDLHAGSEVPAWFLRQV